MGRVIKLFGLVFSSIFFCGCASTKEQHKTIFITGRPLRQQLERCKKLTNFEILRVKPVNVALTSYKFNFISNDISVKFLVVLLTNIN